MARGISRPAAPGPGLRSLRRSAGSAAPGRRPVLRARPARARVPGQAATRRRALSWSGGGGSRWTEDLQERARRDSETGSLLERRRQQQRTEDLQERAWQSASGAPRLSAEALSAEAESRQGPGGAFVAGGVGQCRGHRSPRPSNFDRRLIHQQTFERQCDRSSSFEAGLWPLDSPRAVFCWHRAVFDALFDGILTAGKASKARRRDTLRRRESATEGEARRQEGESAPSMAAVLDVPAEQRIDLGYRNPSTYPESIGEMSSDRIHRISWIDHS